MIYNSQPWKFIVRAECWEMFASSLTLPYSMYTAVRGVLSHVGQLPYELLAEIFFCYLEAVKHEYPRPKLLRIPPLFLSQICSTWRHAVRCTPKLWTRFSLDIHCGIMVKSGKVDHVSFAKAWLSRAVDGILLSTDRLQFLSLCLPVSHFEHLVDIPAGSLALLECVCLETRGAITGAGTKQHG
jgi:hypothetical protein